MADKPPVAKRPVQRSRDTQPPQQSSHPRPLAPAPLKGDPLRYCRTCEFRDVCEKFCGQYFRQ